MFNFTSCNFWLLYVSSKFWGNEVGFLFCFLVYLTSLVVYPNCLKETKGRGGEGVGGERRKKEAIQLNILSRNLPVRSLCSLCIFFIFHILQVNLVNCFSNT
jgi:hypothetical protein